MKKNKAFVPKVAILFAAYNESDVIEHKIKYSKSSHPQKRSKFGLAVTRERLADEIKELQKVNPNIHLYRAEERRESQAS